MSLGLTPPEQVRRPVVVGFHGTSTHAAATIIREQRFLRSENDWDWLGHGIYFWEGHARAWQWAERVAPSNPAVVYATIDLGRCIDLSDAPAWADTLRRAFERLQGSFAAVGRQLPRNRKGARYRDCLVFNYVAEQLGVDTIRSPFLEGGELFTGSALRARQHVQLCVRNEKCIIKPLALLERSARHGFS